MSTIKTLVTYLEMLRPPQNGPESLPKNLKLKRVENISIPDYVRLYRQIGQAYYWTSRLLISESELQKIIHHPNTQIYILFDADIAIGFFELNSKNAPRSGEISFIGLVPHAIGKGYGELLTKYAIAFAWQLNANSRRVGRVVIQTCTLDHKRALPLYQKLGFNAFDRHVAEFQTIQN